MHLARGDIADVLFGEDECLVLTTSACLRLTAVPAAIVELLETPRSEEELGVELEEWFGVAPEGRLTEMLDELRSQGVVRVAADSERLDDS